MASRAAGSAPPPPCRPAAAEGARHCERRAALWSVAGALAGLPSNARGAGPPQDTFTLRLPSRSWKVKKEVQQAIRMRREKVFDAADPGSKASLVVTRTPLGAERSEADERESLVELVGGFQGRGAGGALSKEEVVRIITRAFDEPAARRARQLVSVSRLPEISEYRDVSGQRYVRFGYEAEECTGEILEYKRYDGVMAEDCDGRVLPLRRHLLTATVLPTQYTSMRSNYLDGSSERRSRFIESLWLLDVSAPATAVEGALGADLEEIAGSLEVAPPAFQEE